MSKIRSAIAPAIALAVMAIPAPAPGESADGVPAKVEAALGGEVTERADGLYRVDPAQGPDFTSHGPDLEPATEVAGHGSSLGSGDPERAPVCAADPATDYFQEIIYAYPASGVNDLAAKRATIQGAVRRMNAALNEDSVASGGPTADYVVRCESDGSIKVSAVPVTVSGSASFSQVRTAVRNAGYTNPRVDYSIFYDGSGEPGVCGVASMYFDESLSVSNRNNNPGGSTGAGYATTYSGCWNGTTPMHENGHNQGAVQAGAPYSTGSGAHCYDENDVMCYSPDGGDQNQSGTISRCTDRLYFDCGWDTYFDSAPEPGEWLATHWNMGSHLNRFIAFGAGGQNTAPSADFEVACTSLSCEFTDLSTDSDGTIAAWSWDFGDGTSSTAANPSHGYASPGTYEVALRVTDDDGGSTSLRRQVALVPAPPNDPFDAAETLEGAADTAAGTSLGATKQSGEPDHALSSGGDGGASVWYAWTAPSSGATSVGTCGSDFDTLVAIYESSSGLGGLRRVASNDDSAGPRCGGTRRSEVQFDARAGVSYRIAVDGWDPQYTDEDDPERGSIALALEHTAAATNPPGGSGPPPSADPPSAQEPVVYPAKTLRRGVALTEAAGPPGSVHNYRLRVPRHARALRLVLAGAGLELGLEGPGGESTGPCPAADDGARCRITSPRGGTWSASVENVAAEAGSEFTLRADVRPRRR